MLRAVFTTMPMFVCLFWAIVLLLHYRQSDKAKKVLSVFMLITTGLYFAHCVYFNNDYNFIPFTDTFYSFANVGVYPLYFLYIISLTSSMEFSLKHIIILFPALILGVSIGICYLMMDEIAIERFVVNYMYGNQMCGATVMESIQSYLHNIVKFVFAIQLIPILYLGRKKITAYNKLVMSYYSYTDNKSLHHIKYLLLFFILTTILSFVVNLIGRAWFADSVKLIIFPSLFFSVLLFAIGYVGVRIEFTAKELSGVQKFQVDEGSELNVEMIKLKDKIVEVMEKERLYLRPNLKISDLTQIMSSNRNYIYNAINVNMGVSFSEFVNRYRVSYAKQLIHNSSELNIGDIWVSSGFSSEASFYRNFKLYAGMSPQLWKKESS